MVISVGRRLAAADSRPAAVPTISPVLGPVRNIKLNGAAAYGGLAEDFPNVPEYRVGLAGSQTNLGLLLRDLGRPNEAERACREAVALFDQSSFAKLRLEGPDAETLLQKLCANDVGVAPGRMVYTAMLNERGGFESDLTVTRLGSEAYLIVTGSAQATRRPGDDSHPAGEVFGHLAIKIWLRRVVGQFGSLQDRSGMSAGVRARTLTREGTRGNAS